MNLAKDASSSGDYVLAESYLQHAEHYQRLINGWQEQVDDILSSPQPHLPSTPGNGISYPQNAYQLNKPVASGQDSNLGNGSKIKHQGLDRDDKDTRTSSRVSGNRQPELT